MLELLFFDDLPITSVTHLYLYDFVIGIITRDQVYFILRYVNSFKCHEIIIRISVYSLVNIYRLLCYDMYQSSGKK